MVYCIIWRTISMSQVFHIRKVHIHYVIEPPLSTGLHTEITMNSSDCSLCGGQIGFSSLTRLPVLVLTSFTILDNTFCMVIAG